MGLCGGLGGVVVFERQARQQFLRLQQVRIGFQRLVREVRQPALRSLRRYQRQAQQRVRLLRLDFQRFVEELAASAGWKRSRNSRPQRTRYSALRGCAATSARKTSFAST